MLMRGKISILRGSVNEISDTKKEQKQTQSHTQRNDLLYFKICNESMVASKKKKRLGFKPKKFEAPEKNVLFKEPKGRLISWSPWPPANFKTRYPAFPLVTTIIILLILRWLILAN